jgi:hypothetical protein
MINDSKSAAIVFNAAFEAYVGVDRALTEVAATLPPEEMELCKRAIGQVMGTILFEVTEPILKKHPELLPEVWREKDGFTSN